MTDIKELDEDSYKEGHRVAWNRVLHMAFRELDYSVSDMKGAKYVVEREEAIAMLRGLCREFGDNDWTENTHLADIIDKHLGKYLEK